MTHKTLLLLLTILLSLTLSLNHSRELLKIGILQIEEAKKIVVQYNTRTKYLDSLFDEAL